MGPAVEVVVAEIKLPQFGQGAQVGDAPIPVGAAEPERVQRGQVGDRGWDSSGGEGVVTDIERQHVGPVGQRGCGQGREGAGALGVGQIQILQFGQGAQGREIPGGEGVVAEIKHSQFGQRAQAGEGPIAVGVGQIERIQAVLHGAQAGDGPGGERVVAKIKLRHVGQPVQLGRNGPGQFIVFEMEVGQLGQAAQFGGDAAAQLVVVEIEVGQVGQVAKIGGNRPAQQDVGTQIEIGQLLGRVVAVLAAQLGWGCCRSGRCRSARGGSGRPSWWGSCRSGG